MGNTAIMRKLTPESAALLETRWGKGDEKGEISEGVEATTDGDERFGTPEALRRIERAAVAFVTRDYEAAGWQVLSAEAQHVGYDLVRERGQRKDGSEVKHVDVKGAGG